ncbi:MAG TPA: hypothetical protein VMU04_09795 [Candidatus Acidoferrum sp.]|nr:hypothetical protein [Candidatus Acidoferrum sp.]
MIRWPLILGCLFLLALALPAAAAHGRRIAALRMETFHLASTTRITVGTNHSSSLGDLKVGDHISVSYIQENGMDVAQRIGDGVPHKAHTAGATSGSHHHATTPGLMHMHGVVRALDLQGGTFTITHR